MWFYILLLVDSFNPVCPFNVHFRAILMINIALKTTNHVSEDVKRQHFYSDFTFEKSTKCLKMSFLPRFCSTNQIQICQFNELDPKWVGKNLLFFIQRVSRQVWKINLGLEESCWADVDTHTSLFEVKFGKNMHN